MSGFCWKRNADEILERRRRFFRREMQDGVLATFSPIQIDNAKEWEVFDCKWDVHARGARRPFPSDEEIFEREAIGLKKRGQVEDDWLPVSYSILDAGESMVAGMFGHDMEFIHRHHGPAFSVPFQMLPDYSELPSLCFSLDHPWTRRFLSIQEYFAEHLDGRFAQHPCLTMDALNFTCETRGATQTYFDLHDHPDELRELQEIGLDFNIRFQEAQMEITGRHEDGSFVWLAGWAPFPRAISLSVDAYVLCSPASFVEFGFEYQSRLIEHFGHGLMHFHCNRTDLAAEVARLPGLELFQYGGDPHDPKPDHEYLPEMRAIVGDIPIMVSCPLDVFRARLEERSLLPNVWYGVGGALSVEEANRLMEKVRNYVRD
ncbi:MAG: hypothetical protein QF473_10805 [Planctomycetota bacterium]|jgi:hypothetical protein|nr:hypothetical protein [Planctomycetota bacterium]